MTQAADVVVRRQIVVEAPIEQAFTVFTERFGDFKPPEHNLLGVPIAETVFEPRVGGHITDRGADGSECPWATSVPTNHPTASCSAGTSAPVAGRDGPGTRQRGRGPVHRRGPAAHPGGTGAPPPRPAW